MSIQAKKRLNPETNQIIHINKEQFAVGKLLLILILAFYHTMILSDIDYILLLEEVKRDV